MQINLADLSNQELGRMVMRRSAKTYKEALTLLLTRNNVPPELLMQIVRACMHDNNTRIKMARRAAYLLLSRPDYDDELLRKWIHSYGVPSEVRHSMVPVCINHPKVSYVTLAHLATDCGGDYARQAARRFAELAEADQRTTPGYIFP